MSELDLNKLNKKINQDKTLNTYTRSLIMKKKMKEVDGRGRNHASWEYDEETITLLRMKSKLNLGQFHRGYCNEFGFGYQKLYKIVKANKQQFIDNKFIIVKPAKKKVNSKTWICAPSVSASVMMITLL